jgi:transposase
MRYSFDRLAGLALERVGFDARGGALFVFFGRRRDAVKALFFDGTGMCVFYKRLDQGTYQLPRVEPGARYVELDEEMLDALLDGIEVAVKASVH